MSGLRINRRIAGLVAAIALVFLWWLTAGRTPSVILIDFTTAGPELEGTAVVIDGKVAGTLKRLGSRSQTGFKVKDGDHRIWLRHSEFLSDTATITSGFGGSRVMLMAEFGTRVVNGSPQTVVMLQR